MTHIDDRALEVLRLLGPLRGSDLGWVLWGGTTTSGRRGVGSHGQNKFCRPAGKLLRRLERRGLVVSEFRETCTVWKVL